MSPIDCLELPVLRGRSCATSCDVSRARFARKPIIPGWKCVHKRSRWWRCAVGLDTIACAIRGFVSDDDGRSFARYYLRNVQTYGSSYSRLSANIRLNCSAIWFNETNAWHFYGRDTRTQVLSPSFFFILNIDSIFIINNWEYK